MGAKTCKCDLGEGEEDQLKLSRDAKQSGSYAFPDSASSSATAKGPELGVSALSTPHAGSSHIPPLPPLVLPPPPSFDDRGAHADAAAGVSNGRLPAVTEETGEQVQNELPSAAIPDGENGRKVQLAELKEALLEAVDSTGQLPAAPVPGDASQLEALAKTSAAFADVADAAAGQAMLFRGDKDSGINRIPSSDQPQIYQPGEAENMNMVYGGAAVDAAAADAARRIMLETDQEPYRRAANVDGGHGVILDMTLPAAADIALAAGSREARDAQLQLTSQMQLQQAEQVKVASSPDGDPEADSTRYGCFQLTESSSCGCPLSGNSGLELRRDGVKKNEVYEMPGAPTTVPGGLSAYVIPPAPEIAQADVGNVFSIPPDHDAELMPVPLEVSPEKPSIADGDLRRAGCEAGDPSGPVTEGKHGDSGESVDDAKNIYLTEEGLAGEWVNDGQVTILGTNTITFSSGEAIPLEATSETTCHMVLEGAVYYGRLSPCRQKLMWSDGDVWTRQKKEELLAPAAEADEAAATKAKNPPASSAEEADTKKPTGKTSPPKMDLHAESPTSKSTVTKSGASKKPEDKQDAAGTSEKGGSDTPPRRRCCGCCKKK